MSTEKETAKKATEEKKKETAPVVEKETAKNPVKEEVLKSQEPIGNEEKYTPPTNEEAINSYYDALKEYYEETGSLPDKELNTAQIYGAVDVFKEQKEIAEMKRLEEIEANKPKTFAVTDGKQVINVTETTFKYLGKEWKKAPRVPKEVQELKAEK